MSNDAYHPSMMEEALDGMRRKEIADLKAENERLTQFLQAATIRGGELIAELAACKRERDALRQGIKPVVIWLRNGCDPIEASKELLLLLENGK